MILNYGINNYKCLSISEPLSLSKLTILSGINNTGKSALIKSILDLKEINDLSISYDVLYEDFITKVFEKKKKRKINYKFRLNHIKNQVIDLKIQFAYNKKHDKCFISNYQIIIKENEKVIKFLKIKKKNIEDDYIVDSLKMLDLLFGKTKSDDLPKRFKGSCHVQFISYHPIRVIIDIEKNEVLKKYFKSGENLQFNIPEIFGLFSLSKRISYIGPLRSSPKEYYFLENKSKEIDSSGQNVIEVLNHLKNKNVDYFKTLKSESINESLYDAVKYWIGYFFDNVEFSLKEVSDNLYKVLINRHSIKNSGFGFSQLLPIIVQALLLKEKGVLLLEQPEIHLHPDLEMRLSYFLLCIAKSDKQIIVETHSEHIINNIILEQMKDDKIVDLTKIYFFTKNHDEKTSDVNPIEISKKGQILNWPDGFFDQYYKFTKELVSLRREINAKVEK